MKFKSGKRIKFIKIAAIALLLLLLTVFGVLQYRQYSSYKNTIHNKADLIVKVSVDQLIRKMAWDILKSKSFPEKEESSEEKKEKRSHGIVYPANIFIYNLKDTPNTFFTTLKLKDTTNLEYFLKKRLGITSFTSNDERRYGQSSNKKIQVVYNSRKLVMSYSFSSTNVETILEEILLEKEMMDSGSTLLSSFKQNNADVVAMKDEDVTEVHFKKGKTIISGKIKKPKNLILPSRKIMVQQPQTDVAVFGWFTGTFNSNSVKNKTVAEKLIPLDSLLTYYKGQMQIEIGGEVVQHDTIIAYEYDDDFEKVEVKTIQKKKVPGIKLTIKGDPYNSHRLLEKEKILVDNKLNRDVFPLYELSYREIDSGSFTLGNTPPNSDLTLESTTDFIGLNIDLVQLSKQIDNSRYSDYVKAVKYIKLSATGQGNVIDLNGEIEMQSENLNSLAQFFLN